MLTKMQPVANGTMNGRMHFDPDDPDYIKDMRRPAVIKVCVRVCRDFVIPLFVVQEDLNEMERRKRVNEILANPFRGELEKLVEKVRVIHMRVYAIALSN